MTETQLKNKVQRWVRAQGGFAMKISDRFSAGIPDMWICIDEMSAWIELKTATGKVSRIQQWTIDQINAVGGNAFVCRSLEEVKNVFE